MDEINREALQRCTALVAVLPCGLDATGTPFGIQLVGRYGADAELLGIAAALEAHLAGIEECRRPLPDLERLVQPVPA